MANWMSPKLFLASKGIKITAGMVLDPVELGMPEHPTFGPLPVATVIEAKEDGSVFLHATIECSECGEEREIEPGDWFQVRRCSQHQKRAQRKAKKIAKTPEQLAEEKKVREDKQAAKSAEAQLAKALAKVEALQVKAAKAEEDAAAAAARAELIAKVAAEKGVPVSEKAAS